MSDLTVLDKNNFAAMAEAMGMNADTAKSSGSTLPRLTIDNEGVSEETSLKGKKAKIMIVPAGSYVLKKTDGTKLFQETVEIRLYSQRFQYELYKPDTNSYVRSVLAGNFNSDLPDNAGGMNCGRQRGYVEDYNSLTQEQKDVKRVRVLFGEVKFTDPVDEEGNEVAPTTSPFIWDVKNNEAFKTMGQPATEMMEQQILLPERWISLETEERSAPSLKRKWYVPTASLLPKALPLGKEEQKLFADFNAWIKNSNEQTMSKHKSTSVAPATQSVEVLEDVVEEPEVRKVKKVAPVKSKQSDLGNVVDEIDNWDTDD